MARKIKQQRSEDHALRSNMQRAPSDGSEQLERMSSPYPGRTADTRDTWKERMSTKALTETDEGFDFLEEHAVKVAGVALSGDDDLAESLLYQIEDDIDYFYCKGVARGLWMAIKAEEYVDEEAP